MISVVLVNWNNWSDTLRCIESLFNSEYVSARVIVVDNDSTDDSLALSRRWAEQVNMQDSMELKHRVTFARYIETHGRFDGIDLQLEGASAAFEVIVVESGRNGGFGFGCNVGMRLADILGTKSYWLLNNDCLAATDAMRQISNAIEADPDVIFGAVVRDIEAPHAIQATGGGVLQKWSRRNTLVTDLPLAQRLDYVYGASMAFSAHCRKTVGEFDEKIFMYYEEIDFCLRATQAGFSCAMVNTIIFHEQGGSQGGVSVSAWTNVLLNKYYVLNKHFGWGVWTLAYVVTLLARCVLPIGGKRASIGARNALKAIMTRSVRP